MAIITSSSRRTEHIESKPPSKNLASTVFSHTMNYWEVRSIVSHIPNLELDEIASLTEVYNMKITTTQRISILITIISPKNTRGKDKNQQRPSNRYNLRISLIPSVENKAYQSYITAGNVKASRKHRGFSNF